MKTASIAITLLVALGGTPGASASDTGTQARNNAVVAAVSRPGAPPPGLLPRGEPGGSPGRMDGPPPAQDSCEAAAKPGRRPPSRHARVPCPSCA